MTLDARQVAEAIGPLSHARSMPAGVYTDPAFFAAERERVLLTGWIFLARDDQLANTGDFRTFVTVGGPVALVRGDDGVLRAFANFCRHRGSLLLEGSGNCSRIVCPYHAWSYRIDGRLQHAPDMNDAIEFDRADNGLVEVRLETWAGFVFITYNEAAAPLIETLGDLPQRMQSHRLHEMRCTWTITLETRCNWKLILENAMETYHTGVVHRQSVGAQQSRTLTTVGDWHCIQVTSGRSIATLPGTPPPFDPIAGLDADAQQGTYFTVLHPALQFAIAQDCMWWLNVTPIAHDHSMLEIGGCFPADVITAEGFAANAAPYYERWEVVGREDVGILEKQQRALGSVAYTPGRLSWRDDQVQAVTAWVLERLPEHLRTGQPAG